MVQIHQPTLEEIRAAAAKISDILVDAPLVPLGPPDSDATILLKPEILQAVGSFKIRGVFNAVASMPPEMRQQGLSTVSAGNTAQALAWAGRHFGVPARSIMPDTAPASKIEAVRAYGGEPILVPTEEVFRYLREHGWDSEPYAFIHPWINRDLITGHGSLGLEIVEQCPDVETVFVPVGGGGLMAGVGSAIKALKPSIRLVAVEPEGCPSLHASLEAGRPMSVDCDTICDGVAVPYITEEMFPLLRDLVDESVLVSDDAVKAAMRRIATANKMIAEPSGALAVAAALAIAQERRGLCACIVTGGSIDPQNLAAILGDTQRVEA